MILPEACRYSLRSIWIVQVIFTFVDLIVEEDIKKKNDKVLTPNYKFFFLNLNICILFF